MSIGSPPSDLKNKTLTRRSRSHAFAHAQEDGRQEVITHPMVPRGAPAFISSSVGLSELIGRVRAAGTFAYDSEFIGELTYIPKLCLIQLATTREVALVDPLANGIDLSPFWELVCDPSVEKVVHAGQQDIEPVVRHIGRAPSNVFDTQIAAGFAGMAYPTSLSRLVGEITGARLGKGLTLTHWDQRPLRHAIALCR